MRKAWPWGAPLLFIVVAPVIAQEDIRLEDVEARAVLTDPRILQQQAQAAAGRERSVAAGELPDPRLQLGVENLPVNSFRLDEESMTMVAVGVMQSVPGGRTRELSQERALTEASVAEVNAEVQRLVVVREVREAWLRGYAASQRLRWLEASREIGSRRLGVAEANYRAGRGPQSAAVQQRLRLAELDEREAEWRGEVEAARAALSRWVQTGPGRVWPDALPVVLRETPPTREAALHPEVREAEVERSLAELDIALAEQAYKPEWSIQARYGFRDGIPDLVSVGVDIGLPWFTARRQDRALAAAHSDRLAARHAEQDRRLALTSRRASLLAAIAALTQRLDVIDARLLPERAALVQLARAEYRSGSGSLEAVLEAETEEVETRRQRLDLEIERAQQLIELHYLTGEAGA